MPNSLFGGIKWSPEQIAKMSQKLASPLQINRIKPQYAPSDVPLQVALFPPDADLKAGWDFSLHHWTRVVENGDRERFTPDARAHRDEALRRMVVCRLDGNRLQECDHWRAWIMRFTKNFKLPELKDGDS